jgi:hypothetical protein
MKTAILSAGAAAALCLAATAGARAEPWTDYTPQKGAYIYTLVHVEPGHIDEYLMALKKTWIPSEEDLKRRGLVDSYSVQVKQNVYGDGPNVITVEHWPSLAGLEPDKIRDQEMEAQFRKILPKADEPALQAERAKYRKILSEEMWTSVEYK